MIITIGRQHGSNGHLIAAGLARELGYRCLDKEIVDRAAEDSSFNKAILASYDEKRISPYISDSPHYLGMGEGFRLSTQIAAGAVSATGGWMTSRSRCRTAGSSTAIRLVVCRLQPEGASRPACMMVSRSDRGTGAGWYFPR